VQYNLNCVESAVKLQATNQAASVIAQKVVDGVCQIFWMKNQEQMIPGSLQLSIRAAC